MANFTLEQLQAQLTGTDTADGEAAPSTLAQAWAMIGPSIAMHLEGVGDFELTPKVSANGNAYLGVFVPRFPIQIPGVGEVMVSGNLNCNIPKKVQAQLQTAAAKLEAATDSGDDS